MLSFDHFELSIMIKLLQKFLPFIPILTIIAGLVTMILFPIAASSLGVLTVVINFSMMTVSIIQKHRHTYQIAEYTHEKMARNLSLDLIGLLLTMAAAIFAGGKVGQWAGLQAGMWAGLVEGFAVGFLAAWVVRSLWGKVVRVVAK